MPLPELFLGDLHTAVAITRKDHCKSDGSLNGGDDHGEAAYDDGGKHIEDRERKVHPELFQFFSKLLCFYRYSFRPDRPIPFRMLPSQVGHTKHCKANGYLFKKKFSPQRFLF